MALDLTMQITADATQAKAELRAVEQQIKSVETANKSSVGWWQKEESAIDEVTGTLATHRAELTKVTQSQQTVQTAVSTVEKAVAKLSGTSDTATSALSGMRSESVALSGGFEALAAAGGLSELAITGIVGAAVLAAAAVGALATLVGDSVQYYEKHSNAAKGLRDELQHLDDTWHGMEFLIGGAVMDGANAPIVGILTLVEDVAVRVGMKIAGDILLLKEFLGMMPGFQATSAVLSDINTDTGPLPMTAAGALAALPPGFQQRFGPGDGSMGHAYGTYGAYFDPMNPPSGSTAEAITARDDAARKQRAAEAKRRTDEFNRRMAANQEIIDHGLTYRLGLSGQIGEQIGRPTAPFDPSDMLRYQLGIRGGSLGEAVSVQDMLAGVTRGPSFGSRVFSSAGTDIGHTLMRLLVERGDTGSALGASVGGDVFSSLMTKGSGSGKAISGTLSGLFGDKIGGAIGNFLPFGGQILGSLVGKLFGGLFGETQGHKDLTAGNTQISDMKDQLMGVYGTMTNLQSVGKMFGIDWQATWGDQNLQGAKHFQSVMDDLAKKQQAFNDHLGGTLTQIQALGGNIPEALIPYLDQLKDAKVLTQDNIDLIAKMSGQNTVDFDKMEEAANRYGISIDALGQQFKDNKMHKSWQQIIDDMDLLQRGGADMNGVLDGMADEIDALVIQSIQFGTAIPDNMKPWIQQLIDAGKLLDASGNKITDINQLSFGDTMQTTLDHLNDTLKALIDALGVKFPKAAQDGADGFHRAFDGLTVPGIGSGDNGNGPGGGSNPRVPQFASGTDGYQYFGAGRLAMLHGWEKVTPLGRESGGGGGAMVIDMRGAFISDDAAMSRFVDRIDAAVVQRTGRRTKFRASR